MIGKSAQGVKPDRQIQKHMNIEKQHGLEATGTQ
jgi:hypothetical protein